MPKVSVIIPVYNTENYLRDCLDSITGQTLEDIEILCIDDCSTDFSLQILYEYAQRDSRIRVFRNSENKGLSATRNVGIDNACGEYIQFVDSDDMIEQDTLEMLYRIALDNRLDMLKFLMDWSRKIAFDDSSVNSIFSGQEMLKNLIDQAGFDASSCVYFFDRCFLQKNQLRFSPKLRYAEDSLFTFQALALAQRCMCINELKYIYRKRKNSLTTSPLKDEKVFSLVYLLKALLETDLSDDGISYRWMKFVYFCQRYEMAMGLMDTSLKEPDMSQWDPEIQEIYKIFFSGQGWLENLVNRRKLSQNKEAISSAERLYVFGAGQAAQRLIQILYRSGIEINGVIVSDKSKNRRTVYGYPVFSANEISLEEGQPLVLSAVKGAYNEIYDLLNKHGFDKIINVCP